MSSIHRFPINATTSCYKYRFLRYLVVARRSDIQCRGRAPAYAETKSVSHFLPLCLIPPVASGPLPLAFSAISFLAFASVLNVNLLFKPPIIDQHTSLLLRLVRYLLFIHLLLLLLWSLERLGFAACEWGSVCGYRRFLFPLSHALRVQHVPSLDAPPISKETVTVWKRFRRVRRM